MVNFYQRLLLFLFSRHSHGSTNSYIWQVHCLELIAINQYVKNYQNIPKCSRVMAIFIFLRFVPRLSLYQRKLMFDQFIGWRWPVSVSMHIIIKIFPTILLESQPVNRSNMRFFLTGRATCLHKVVTFKSPWDGKFGAPPTFKALTALVGPLSLSDVGKMVLNGELFHITLNFL